MRGKEIGVGVYYPKPLHSFDHIAKLGFAIGDFPEAEKQPVRLSLYLFIREFPPMTPSI